MSRAPAILIAFLLNLFVSLNLHRCQALLQGSEGAVGTRTLMQEVIPKHEVHCSRERSRTAWGIIEEYLMPFVELEEYQIPNKCRLHPDNDIFREQEQHKIHVDTNEWRCGFCKKSFYAEKYLDQHYDNRHYNLINDIQGRCLADLCGALHCDAVIESKKTKNKCNPVAVAKNRHLCESLADTCFPINHGTSASHLHELFLRQFCDSHTCEGRKKLFPRGGRKQTSVLYLACCVLIVLLLPIFYLLVWLHQRDMRAGTQGLKRISKKGQKSS